MRVKEHHFSNKSPFLRAAVLGANDGIISMSGVIAVITAANGTPDQIKLTVLSALIAGALSMGAGEYISVSSQLDSEKADIKKEKAALKSMPDEELEELIENYLDKGLDRELATKVAVELTRNNALKHHLIEEVGLDPDDLASPSKAALISFISFLIGGGVPSIVPFVFRLDRIESYTYAFCLASLLLLGFISSKFSGSSGVTPIIRVVIAGSVVLFLSWLIGGNALAY